MNLLALKNSIHGDQGNSSVLVDALIESLRAEIPDLAVTQRQLGIDTLPHLNAEQFAAFSGAPVAAGSSAEQGLAVSGELIEELKTADLLVIGMPFYNFGPPSSFKAWADYICRVGHTFNYTSDGPKGLVSVKKAWVLASRGGQYAGTPMDSQTPWLNILLGFIGVGEPEYIYAEGLARSATKDSAMSEALDAVRDSAVAYCARG